MKTSLDELWVNWKDCLARDDDINPIFNQLTLMVWDTAIYRVILRGRDLRWKANPDNPQVNAEFHNFIDRNYFQTQCATVRRLVDNTRRSIIHGDLGVYSLGALVKDIEKHQDELTRGAFLKVHKMPYDYSDIQDTEREFFFARRFNENLFTVPPDMNWQEIEDAHQQFDRLSNVTQAMRRPDDRIEQRVFVGLRAQMRKCDLIVKHVDKYIAHSSTQESRSKAFDPRPSLSDLWDAQKYLYEIANFLRVSLFLVDTVPLPVESFSFFKRWDKPLFQEDEECHIRDVYKNYEEETDGWRLNSVENMWKVIEEQ